MGNKVIRILLISIESINNAGDELLRLTTEYLVKKASSNCVCMQMQFRPRFKDIPLMFRIDYLLGSIIVRLSNLFKREKSKFRVFNIGFRIQFYRYYYSKIRRADELIYSVGMLKYSTQQCSFVYYLINKIANRLGKPVFMSAMSVEPAVLSDLRYRQLLDAVSFPCVKQITTRDGEDGLIVLRRDYVKNRSVVTDFVGDPALWTNECFNIKKDYFNPRQENHVIGIGLVRKDIFQLYHNPEFTEDRVFNLYRDIITIIKEKGWRFYLFCNGIQSDYLFGKELVERMNLPPDTLLSIPKCCEDFIDSLMSFDAIIGGRLHACVCAVTLGIPVAGFLWDRKLLSFSKTMRIQDHFCPLETLTGEQVIKRLESAIHHSFDWDNFALYKQKTLNYVSLFVNQKV